MLLSLTLVQIPAVILRYLPFSQLVAPRTKRKLLHYYIFCFLIQHFVIYFYLTFSPFPITPLTYKQIIFVASLTYVTINIVVIKDYLFQHLFVFSMQSGYSLILHSFIAFFIGMYGTSLTLSQQCLIQTTGYLILFIIVTVPLWKVLKSSLVLKHSVKQTYYWNIIWLIPTLAVYSDVIVTMNIQWIHSWQQIASRLMTSFAIFISWKYINHDFQFIEEILTLKDINKILQMKEEAIYNQANTLKENDKKIRILKHDMRHHLNLLSSLIEHENYTEATQLISQLNDTLHSTKPIVFCKNTVINSVLLVYISMAQDKNIEIISEVDIPEHIPWNSNDIGVIFANALDNAIYASRKQDRENRQIHINTRYSDKKLAIVIKNKFNGEILFDKKGFPITSKKNHGVGMLSISTIASKYQAHVSCSFKDNWFTISFLFSECFVANDDNIYIH